jgi:hypothetical protein
MQAKLPTVAQRWAALPPLTLLMEVRVEPLSDLDMATWRMIVLEPACRIFSTYIEAQSKIMLGVAARADVKVAGERRVREVVAERNGE